MKIKKFQLILNNPDFVLPKGKGHSLKSIFSACFEYPTDSLDIIWYGERLKLSYKYQVPYLIFTILEMVKDICSHEIRHHSAYLVTDQLETNWELSWDDKQILIHSNWLSAPGNIQAKLNEKGELCIDIQEFLAEWCKLLQFIDEIIINSGIQIKDFHFNKEYFKGIVTILNKKLKNNS